MSAAASRRFPPQFFGFLAVGALNTLWAYALFALFVYIGLHYTVATLLAGVLSVLSGYKAHRRFVFAFDGEGRLSRFIVAFTAVYFANVAIQRVLLEYAGGLGHYGAGAFATAACAVLGFWVNKRFVFR